MSEVEVEVRIHHIDLAGGDAQDHEYLQKLKAARELILGLTKYAKKGTSAILAGGICRDIVLKHLFKVDANGSGDLDLHIVSPEPGLCALWLQGIRNELVYAFGVREDDIKVNACYDAADASTGYSADPRLECVIQFKWRTFDVDIVVYKNEFENNIEVLDSFNTGINKYMLWGIGDRASIASMHTPNPFGMEYIFRTGSEADWRRANEALARHKKVIKALESQQPEPLS